MGLRRFDSQRPRGNSARRDTRLSLKHAERREIVWLETPVRVTPESRTLVIGYDSRIAPPAWLAERKAA